MKEKIKRIQKQKKRKDKSIELTGKSKSDIPVYNSNLPAIGIYQTTV